MNCFVSTHHQLRHRREIGLDHNVIQSESSRRKEQNTNLEEEVGGSSVNACSPRSMSEQNVGRQERRGRDGTGERADCFILKT